jgi:acetate kinase
VNAGRATRVLVLNSGSSSVKYQLIDMADGSRPATGLVERIGEHTSYLQHLHHTPAGGTPRERERPIATHADALHAVAAELAADGLGLDSPRLAAIGHRVVHGGQRFTAPTPGDETVLAEIERLVPLAPLHNPANITGIRTALALNPALPQVAVFDTAFHTTIPEHAARYAIDTETETETADKYQIRRYGFHGTSHAYVSRRTAQLLGREPSEVNVIVLHLGNGASASAVAGGRCVETSMGLTPLEGLVMGTRSGDVDAVAFTAGVGENSAEVRAAVLTGLGQLGLDLDTEANARRSRHPRLISPEYARTAVAVVPTDEELEIATQTYQLVTG